jgi:pectinesterase
MGNHIKPEGWHNWSKPEAEKTAYYAEYQSSGAGSNSEKRVAWSHQLKKCQAKKYTIKKILGEKKRNSNHLWYEINQVKN